MKNDITMENFRSDIKRYFYRLGKIFFIVGIVLGIIVGLAVGVSEKNLFFGILAMLATAGTFILNSAIFYAIFEVLTAFERINTNISNIGYYISGSQPNEPNILSNANILSNGGWTCSKCGAVNPGYVGTCKCGSSKP